jgi:hypothetical protein
MAATIQFKRGLAASWTSVNPTLAVGECGFETDTKKLKIGTGSTAWNSLTYFVGDVSAANLNDLADVTITSATDGDFLRWNGTAWINDAVNLSTDTVGNYMVDLTQGTGVTITHTPGEGSNATIAIGQSVATGDSPTFAGLIINGASIVLEGATANDFETTIAVTDPTADRTITFPDLTGTVALVSDLTTHANLTEAHGATGAVVGTTNTQTLTNKTLTTPTINGPEITATGGTPRIHGIYLPEPHFITFEGATTDEFETVLTVVNPTADRTVSLPDATTTLVGVDTTDTLTNKTLTSPVINTPTGIAKADVGLGSVDNTADTAKPVSTAQQTALDLKANLASPTFTGTLAAADITISGDLTVNGTTTTINSTTLTVDDKNIELGSVTTPTDVTADGGGITLKGTTDKTLNWVDATDAWTSSEDFNLLTGKAYEINGTSVLNATTLGSGVTGSSLTSLGTIATGVWNGTLIGATYGGTGVNNGSNTITLGGNFTTSGAFTTTLTATATTTLTLPTTGTLTTLDGTETFTNKTFTSPVTNSPTLTLSTSSSTTDARLSWDSTNKKLKVGNGTISLDFASSNVITNAQVASYTLVLADKDKLVEISNASANTLTVPLNSSVAFPIGTQITILQTGAGATTITATGGVTINATPGLILRAQWSSVTLIKRAENTWVALGDLRA